MTSLNLFCLIVMAADKLHVTYLIFSFHKFSEVLYPELESLPVPDYTDPQCAMQMSAMCILMHILKKAQADSIKTPRSLPTVFKNHHEYVSHSL